MLNRSLLVGMLLLVMLDMRGQTTCYTDQAVAKQAQADPQLARKLEQFFSSFNSMPPPSASRGARTIYTIPVVFHVVLNTQNKMDMVADWKIYDQLQTLNNDFRRLNSDTNRTRAIFKPVAADVGIEFCLASRKPDGDTTSGIINKFTSKVSWDYDTETNDMKYSSRGGDDAWDPTSYLNVWIVDLVSSSAGGEVGGYAYPPPYHGTAIDGVVLDYVIGFGPYDRSLTHEVGHYLGLQHTWGNGGCNSDDGISDTPRTDQANFGCDQSTNSCHNESPDLPDMIENYMDYSSCPNIFTEQQAYNMQVSLTGTRASLLSSLGCQAPYTPPTANFDANKTTVCPGGTVAFSDISYNLPNSWNWLFPGGIPATSTQQNPTVTYPDTGRYDVFFSISNQFGTDDLVRHGYVKVDRSGNCPPITPSNATANFSSDIHSGCNIVTVNFHDASINANSWHWDFPGGNPNISTQQNPTIVYNAPGKYSVVLRVTDQNGHTNTKLVNNYVRLTDPPLVTISGTDATCLGINNGTIDLTVTNGVPPYTYLWSNAETTKDISDASPGLNTVTVTDANGCSVVKSKEIGTTTSIELLSVVNPDSAGTGQGSISVAINGGSPPFNYTWDDADSSVVSHIFDLVAGHYTVTASDASGCEVIETFIVADRASTTSIDHLGQGYQLDVYPNPVKDLVRIFLKFEFPQQCKMVLYNSIGQVVLDKDFGEVDQVTESVDLSFVESGIYQLRIEAGKIHDSRKILLLR